MKVKASEIRAKLGLSEPEEEDEVVGGRIDYTNPPIDDDFSNEPNNNLDGGSSINNGVNYLDDYGDYIEIENEIAEVLEKAFDKAESFVDIKKAIENLSVNWDSSKIAEIMATAFFMARARGDNDFNQDTDL